MLGLTVGSPNHRREIVRRISAAPGALVTTARALQKWRHDSQFLPLTRHHLGLYLRIHRYMWRTLGRFPDLVGPESFNDKIQWLKLFDQSPLQVTLSDKVEVKEHVAATHPKLVSRTLHVLDNAHQLKRITIVGPCAIKASHDSGSTVIVRDAAEELDTNALAGDFARRLRSRFGHSSGEWSYPLVRPRILVEELLPEAVSDDLPDFKFHCVDGRVAWLQYIFGRFSSPSEVIVNRDGQPLGVQLDKNFRRAVGSEFQRPDNWADLVRVAEELATGWKYVRVDLYNSTAGVRFGEFTFFPYAGCYRGDGQRSLGQLMDFDWTTFQPPLTRLQRRRIRSARARPVESTGLK